MSRTPLVPFAAAFIIGILLQGWGVGLLLPLVVTVVSIVACWKRHLTLGINLLALPLGFFVSFFHQPIQPSQNMIGHEFFVSGVAREVKAYESLQVLVVDVDSCDGRRCQPMLVKLIIPSSRAGIEPTDRINCPATFSLLSDRRDLPYEVDYNRSLRRAGVNLETWVDYKAIDVIGEESGLMNGMKRLQSRLMRLIVGSGLSTGTKEFFVTTLAGDSSLLSQDTRSLFSATGLAHILALSGLHVGIITWVISLMLFPLWLAGHTKSRVCITIILLWIFACVTGLSPSVVRAVIMATLFMTAYALQRVRSPFNSLAAAAILILFFAPASLYSVGFQLSFLSVAAILLFAVKLNPFKRSSVLPHRMMAFVTVPVSAMIGTGIVSAYYFNIFPMYFLLSNVVAALILPVILSAGILFVMGVAFGVEVHWLGDICDWLYSLMMSVSEWIGHLPGAMLTQIYLPEWLIVMYFSAIVFVGIYIYRRRVVWLTISLMVLVFSVTCLAISSREIYSDDVYITRSSRETSMFIVEGRRMWLITTAYPIERPRLVSKVEVRYSSYLSRRGIDSISVMPDRFISPKVARNGNVVNVLGKTFVFINHSNQIPSDSVEARIDYAIVCGGFTGNVLDVAVRLHPDTIFLSSDLNRRRHDRYFRELNAAGVAFRSLRERGFHAD